MSELALRAEPDRRHGLERPRWSFRSVTERRLGRRVYDADEPVSHNTYTYAQHWDGTTWTTVPTPNPVDQSVPKMNVLKDVAVVGRTEAWAVGYHWKSDGNEEALVEHWDGGEWRVVPTPRLGQVSYLYAVAGASPSDVWAVGSSGDKGLVLLVLHWKGSAWSIARAPIPRVERSELRALDARAGNDVWAAGYGSGRRTTPLVEHWNGKRWRIVRLPRARLPASGKFEGLAVVSRKQLWAVGSQYDGHSVFSHTLAARWNGRSWSFMRGANRRYEDNELVDVAAVPGGGAWAVGAWSPDQGPQVVAQRWDGHRWRTVKLARVRAGWLADIELVSGRQGWAVGGDFHHDLGYHPLTERLGPC